MPTAANFICLLIHFHLEAVLHVDLYVVMGEQFERKIFMDKKELFAEFKY